MQSLSKSGSLHVDLIWLMCIDETASVVKTLSFPG